MSTHDDRPWKAEDMLHSLGVAQGDSTASTRERVERFFDRMDSSMGTLPTVIVGPREEAGVAWRDPGYEDASPALGQLPAELPVAVPGHELIRCLGAGGFGQVWLARHALTEHFRACKLIPAEKTLELDGLKQLKQRVPPHQNLFPIEEVGASGQWLYCLMPLADPASSDHAVLDPGGYEPLTLGVYIQRQGRRPTIEVAAVGIEVAGAVRVLHEHGVTHGDIKPDNIMRLGGRWTLADYGLARDLASPTGEGHTPGYVPPEGAGSRKADLYALGVVLMELMTSWPARIRDDFLTTPIEDFKLDTSAPAMARIVRRAIAEDPRDRFGSVEELIEALRPLANDRAGQPARAATGRTIAIAGAVVVALASIPLVRYLGASSPGATSASVSAAASGVAPSSPTPAIESFDVMRYRYEPANGQIVSLGPINGDNLPVFDDDVTVHARFSDPAYVYLISLDTDGTVELRWPPSPDEPPPPIRLLDYPSQPLIDPDGELYRLDQGSGVQGFMLMLGRDPLPPWAEWTDAHGVPPWNPGSLPGRLVINADKSATTVAALSRDPLPRRGTLVVAPAEWARAHEQFDDVRFVGFPVRPDLDTGP